MPEVQRAKGCVIISRARFCLHDTKERSEADARGCLLIVDDDDDLRDTMADLFRDEGFSVATARDGRQALAYLATHAAPCLILLDLMMPVMSGEEFRQAQLGDARLADIPVVVLSASHDGQALASQMNASAFLAKPPRIEALIETVARYC